MKLDDKIEYYRQMFLIRKFELSLFKLFEEGVLNGTTHTCVGQEHIAVGYINLLCKEKDVVFSNHRCHGHFLVYSGDPYLLACELMGRVDGINRGLGGSQHLHYMNFYTNGIQGGIVANATGVALAEKLKKTGSLTTVFLGDGTLGQGIVYESFNIASLWKLPIVFLIENNKYAQSTPIHLNLAGTIRDRVNAFGIHAVETNEDDPVLLSKIFADVISYVRNESRPASVIVNTYRLAAHSMSDDCRDVQEVAYYKRKDPLVKFRSQFDQGVVQKIEDEVMERLNRTFSMAKMSPKTAKV